MSDISQIISVSIAVQDSAPKAVSFDTPLLVGKAPFVGTREYRISPSGLAAMVTDGFPTYARMYQQMSRMAGQSGGAGTAVLYSRTTQQTHVLDFTVDIAKTAVGQVLEFDISYQGVTSSISVTVVTNTVNDILDLVESAIDASLAGLAGIGVAPDNATATKLTLTADVAGDFILIDLGGDPSFSIEDVSTDGSLAAQLAVAKAALGESVYGLLIDGFSETEINLAAAFAEANAMVFLGQSADQEILESGQTDDVASDLESAGYNRAAVCFTRNMSSDWAAGLMGRQLGQTAGSSSWAMKSIAGAEADVLSTTHFNAARAKKALMYTTVRGTKVTWDGQASSGRLFSITHGVDFLKADIETRMFQVLTSAEKLGFAPADLGRLEAALRGALAGSEAAKLIEPGWTVEMPDLVGYSTVDKAARLLRTIGFSAVLTGEVQEVTVAGVLTL